MKYAIFGPAAVLSGLLVLAASGAIAQDSGATQESDPIVARVNGAPVHQSELITAARQLPAQYQATMDQVLPILLERLIDLRLIGEAGRAEGLAEDAQVKSRVQQAENRIIGEIYLEQQVSAQVTDERIRGRYEEIVESTPPSEEIKARHILLKTEQEARDTINALDTGVAFVELAEERSTGPSASKGGDLGYFTADQMVAPFSEAAFAMEPGSYSKEPVETQFGFHVILVEDRRKKEPPTFDDLEGQIREELAGQAVKDLVQGLREKAEIEIEPLDNVMGAMTGEDG